MHERNEESQHQNGSRCIVLETFVCRFAYVDLLERGSWSRSKGLIFIPEGEAQASIHSFISSGFSSRLPLSTKPSPIARSASNWL